MSTRTTERTGVVVDLASRSAVAYAPSSRVGSVDDRLPSDLTSSTRRPWYRLMSAYLIGSDVLALALGVAVMPVAGLSWEAGVLAATTVIVLACAGRYRGRLTLSVLDDLPLLAGATVMGAFAQVAVRDLSGGQAASLGGLLWVIAAVFGGLVVSRVGVYSFIRFVRSRGLVAHRTLVLGAGPVGRRVAQIMIDHPEYGLDPVGFLDPSPERRAEEELPLPVLGTHEDLANTIRREGISEVILAFGADADASEEGAVDAADTVDIVSTVRECDRMDCEIFAIPRFFELHRRSASMDELRDVPLIRLRRASWRSFSWRIKRAIDASAAAIMLMLLAPVMAMVALVVRIENGRGVIFKQVRVGLDGEPFTIYKFRSVRPAPGTANGETSDWSVGGSAKLGRMSRFLRAASLDELPQLVNILKGEMSFVGPRPEREHFVEEFAQDVPHYRERHRTPAGLTGWAQVNGLRGDTSITERANFDNYYIQNWSLWLDFRIVVMTVATVVLRRGA